MIRSLSAHLWKSRAAWMTVLVALVAQGLVILAAHGIEARSLWRDRAKATMSEGPEVPFTRRIAMEGLSRPPATPAESARLAEDEEVIGVVVDGAARAYRLKALEYPPWHIVNDLVGGSPVTVAYCDLSGCVRVYGGPGDAPLGVSQAGLVDREMVVTVAGVDYVHRTGRPLGRDGDTATFPYPNRPWTRTTWGAWKRAHPGTDVFINGPGPPRD